MLRVHCSSCEDIFGIMHFRVIFSIFNAIVPKGYSFFSGGFKVLCVQKSENRRFVVLLLSYLNNNRDRTQHADMREADYLFYTKIY